MSQGSQKALEALAAVVKEMKLKAELTEISYRPDYQDYQVIFDDTHHCEIREKLIEDYMATKNGDALREMHYLFNHLIAWEEWDRPEKSGPSDGKMEIDKEI